MNGNGNYSESYSYNATTGNLASKTGLGNYTYNAQVTCAAGTRTIPHAVSSAGGNSYTYDCNGSQVQRNVGGTQNLSYNAENKLVSVSGTVSANFVYDGDGKRVKSTINGSSVVYIGNDYEWTSSGVTQYYTTGSQRVGMRRSGYAANNGLFWLMGDHLGSTSVTASENGSLFSEQRYTAWGTNRFTSGSLLSQRQYTGQINDGFGLYFYNARFYDPLLARFAQADTEVPESQDGKGLDRYAYVANNPVIYDDPGGNCWGIASSIRGIPSYDTTCNNLDMALEIVKSPKANTGQKAAAGGYIAVEAAAHAGVIVGAAGLACGAIGSCAAAVEAALGIGSTRVIDVSSTIGKNVWSMNPLDRGWVIENALGRSPELARNFPTIDRYSNGIVTSIKSINLGAKTYQNLSALSRTVQGYVNQLSKFNGATWGGFRITSDMISGRQLILAITTNATPEQLKLLQELQEWALNQGVDLLLQTVK